MSFSPAQLPFIPALPLVASAATALLPRRRRRTAIALAIGSLALSFVLSCFALHAALTGPARTAAFDWFDLGSGTIRLGWLLDPLGAFMAVMVSFVGTLIFIFSVGYMRADANATRFFCFMSLFAAAMLAVVVANSLLLLFIAWEIVGLASYLLIGFWFQRPEAAAAAQKAFVTTRIGDLGFLLGLLWIQRSAGTLLFYDHGRGFLEAGPLGALASAHPHGAILIPTAIALLLFCGAVGKSGQFPLHVWLPDAMEGPSPVSALIHAATMVAAGVFLVARVYPLMRADFLPAAGAPAFHALTVVAGIGAFTALLGASIAVAQYDIKRVLAFSTVSQLGYMMLALGVGSWVAAIFHLLTHAFFKALLFLGAGSVIDAAHHEQDIRRLGGMRGRQRVTFATFAIGMMALSGVPFLFSGYWSKEMILHAAHAWPVSWLPFGAALAGVVLTAFYMTRLVAEVFLGPARSESAEHARESSWVMTMPLVVLAAGAVLLGFLGTPAWPWLQSALQGGAHPRAALERLGESPGLTSLSIVLVALGIGSGWALYARRPRAAADAADPLSAAWPGAFAFLAARCKFDELYGATVVRLHRLLAALAAALDVWLWGGGVATAARAAQFAGWVDRRADERGLNAGFDAAAGTLRGAGLVYSRAQSGAVQGYLRILAVAFVVLALIVLGGAAK